jgi:hypothetical protein
MTVVAVGIVGMTVVAVMAVVGTVGHAAAGVRTEVRTVRTGTLPMVMMYSRRYHWDVSLATMASTTRIARREGSGQQDLVALVGGGQGAGCHQCHVISHNSYIRGAITSFSVHTTVDERTSKVLIGCLEVLIGVCAPPICDERSGYVEESL